MLSIAKIALVLIVLLSCAFSQQICLKQECPNEHAACDQNCQNKLTECTFQCTLGSEGCIQDCLTGNQPAINLLYCSFDKCINL